MMSNSTKCLSNLNSKTSFNLNTKFQSPTLDICEDEEVQSENGFIQTPNYPGSYTPSSNCNKTIPAPPPGKVSFHTKIFFLI